MQFQIVTKKYTRILTFLKIFAILPVITCVNERLFSTIHLLKTYFRSTMAHSSIDWLCIAKRKKGLDFINEIYFITDFFCH